MQAARGPAESSLGGPPELKEAGTAAVHTAGWTDVPCRADLVGQQRTREDLGCWAGTPR